MRVVFLKVTSHAAYFLNSQYTHLVTRTIAVFLTVLIIFLLMIVIDINLMAQEVHLLSVNYNVIQVLYLAVNFLAMQDVIVAKTAFSHLSVEWTVFVYDSDFPIHI